mgnify:CR=1 FL=1
MSQQQEQPIISKLKQISAKVSTTKMSSKQTIPEPEELVIDGQYNEDGCYCAELDFETIAEVPEENSGMVEIGDEEIPYAKVWNDWVKKDGVQEDIIESVNDAIHNFIENEVPDLIEMYAKQYFNDYVEDLEKAHTEKQEEKEYYKVCRAENPDVEYFDTLHEAKAFCDKHADLDYGLIMLCDFEKNEIGDWGDYDEE